MFSFEFGSVIYRDYVMRLCSLVYKSMKLHDWNLDF